jgi:hypothetical protein
MSAYHLLANDEQSKASRSQALKKLRAYKLENPNEPAWVYEEVFTDYYDEQKKINASGGET